MIGLIPALSQWGKNLAIKGRKNHPYYRHAQFHTITQTKVMLEQEGFLCIEAWSTLFQPPSKTPYHEAPVHGESEEAGFCVLTASKQGV